MNEAEGNFSPLEKFFRENFGGNLQYYICESVSQNQFYMRISNNFKSTELTYLPSFHIIGLCLSKEVYSLKLVTYHCKLLEEYHLDITDRILTVPPKLKNFCQNTLSLCLGVGHGCDVKAYDDDDILSDVLNDEVIARSRKCLYITNSSRTSCAECHKLKLLSDLKSDLGSDQPNVPSIEVDVRDMVEAGETIVTEIVLFPLRQKGEEVVKENVQANDVESQDVVLDNPDDEETVLSKMEVSDLSLPVSVSLTTDSSSAGTSTRPTRNRRVSAIGKQRVTNDLVADLKGQVAKETFVEKKRSSRECSKCGEKFKLFSTLKRHLIESKQCSRDRRKRRKRIEMKDSSETEEHLGNRDVFCQQCPICLHTYNQKIQFDLDQKNHEENLPELDSPVSCPVCDVTVDQRRLLNGHFHSAHNTKDGVDRDLSICCVCFAEMPRKRLKYHFRERHKPKDNGLLCPVCGKTIKWTQHDLKIHLACAHGLDEDCSTPTTLHVCPECGKSYGHADRLKQHVFRAHQSATSFPCDECDKVFCALSKIIEHKVCKHLKIRPFKCRLCDYVASQMNNVYKHCQNKHGFRGKRGDVEVDQELMVKIRKDLNYDYCGQSVQKVYSK